MTYIDDYGTCEATYATLCIYPKEVDPLEITRRLGIDPSSWQRAGELPQSVSDKYMRKTRPAKISAWFLTSQDSVNSRDSRRHIDWLLSKLASSGDALRALQAADCKMHISCYWASAVGHGGPTVSASQMQSLGALNLDLEFDLYEYDEKTP